MKSFVHSCNWLKFRVDITESFIRDLLLDMARGGFAAARDKRLRRRDIAPVLIFRLQARFVFERRPSARRHSRSGPDVGTI